MNARIETNIWLEIFQTSEINFLSNAWKLLVKITFFQGGSINLELAHQETPELNVVMHLSYDIEKNSTCMWLRK